MSSDPAIRVRNISKEYKLGLTGRTDSLLTILERRLRHPIRGRGTARERFLALDDVSFDIEAGEAVGIIGRNGAGKSTLLKILSRITPPTGGYAEIVGTVGCLLEVGTGFHPELTGIENIYLNGTILGMTKTEIDGRIDEIIAFAEVDKFLETPVKRYSSGMRVRLAFAVAAHLEPEILVVDEVLSVGDAGFQAKCLNKMKSVTSEDGRTVLYVSHNLVTLENLCPRTLLLVDGRLVFDGPTVSALSQYLHMLPHAEQGAQPGTFDLATADRTGTDYERVFTYLTLRVNGGPPTDKVRMGDRLSVEITVDGLSEIPEGVVILTIGSSTTQCLARMTSRMQPLPAPQERCPVETIVLDIPSVPLTPGDYHLNVEIAVDPRIGGKTVDEVHHAAEFSVVPADVLGTGHRFGPDDGEFVVPWDWEIRPATNGSAPGAVSVPAVSRAQ